jgi:hypothetical protein
MDFFLISSLFAKINARNIKYMAVLNFQKRLNLRKNASNPTGSLEAGQIFQHKIPEEIKLLPSSRR